VDEEQSVRDEAARTAFNEGRLIEAFELNSALLRNPRLAERERPRIEANRDLSAPAMEAAVLLGAAERRRWLTERASSAKPEITLTVTTCRRLELFVRTMDSFLVACTDIERVGRFVCIDDGSSPADRAVMRQRYPFFEFILKTEVERGHARSMNLLRETVRSKYWLHLEDDFQFFEPRAFIGEACAILQQEPEVAQVLFNRGYAEDTQDRNVDAGELRHLPNGTRFWRHVYEREPKAARPGRRSLAFWPHFSLRPSLMRTKSVLDIGPFDESPIHFEREFGERYLRRGNHSAFLDTICSRHIGRLLEERDAGLVPNAYQLNGQRQFGEAQPSQIRVTVGIVIRTPTAAEAVSRTVESLRRHCRDLAHIGAWLCASEDEASAASDELAARLPFLRIVHGGFAAVLGEARGRYLLYVRAGQEFAQPFSIVYAIEQILQGQSKIVALSGSAAVRPSPAEPNEPCLLEVEPFRAATPGAAGMLSEPKRAYDPIPSDAEWQPETAEWLLCSRDEQGALHGALRAYRESGALALVCELRHGVRHGPFERYSPSGALAQRGRHFGGELDGLLTTFGEQGAQHVRQEFRVGTLLADDDSAGWPKPLREREGDVLLIAYDFWPAFEPVTSLATDEDVNVEQSAEAMRSAVARAAQRVQACRELALARGLSSVPPDVHALAADTPPRRGYFESDEGEMIRIDETLELAHLTERGLELRSRLEWLGLCWLCWSAGLNAVQGVDRVLPRPEFHAVLATVATRIERLQALEPSSDRHFHRLDEARLPASALAILAQYYREIRAALLFSGDPECRSPWQDDLGRDQAH